MIWSPSTAQSDPLEVDNRLTFVVGTGRCGSTMISNILREHPAVLSLSEFFVTLEGPKFPAETLDASQFWALLSTPSPLITTMLRHDLLVPEFLYQVSSTSRYTAETGVPPLLLTTLPHLTSDYEALYDEVRQVVSGFPPARIALHYAHLFRWMKYRFGREVCVERSAFSLLMVRSLAQLFPTAKFVHLVRDGRACALSMSRHLLFRLVAIVGLQREVLGVDPYYSSDRTKAKDLNEDLRRLLPEQFDVDVFWNYQLPLEVFGSLWTTMLIAGISALLELPEEHVLTLTYEQFLAQPQASIKQLITFIDPSLLDETWVHSTATQIRQTPLSWKELPLSERKSLEAACQPGLALLELVVQEGLHSKRLPDLLLPQFRHSPGVIA